MISNPQAEKQVAKFATKGTVSQMATPNTDAIWWRKHRKKEPKTTALSAFIPKSRNTYKMCTENVYCNIIGMQLNAESKDP
jgi:hypothetical protein